MTRQALWAKKARANLIHELGGCCVACGSDRYLEFDHIDPLTRRWIASQHGSYKRMLFYRVEAKEGKLQILCKKCNRAKSRQHDIQQLFALKVSYPQRAD